MVHYNKHKTAYLWMGSWYLIPRGKTRAPLFNRELNLPGLLHFVGSSINEEDREILLNAHDAGILGNRAFCLRMYDAINARIESNAISELERILDEQEGY